MLTLLDGSALPADVQRLVARSLAEARPPWERPMRLDVQLALTTVVSPQELIGSGRLDPALAARLGGDADAPVVLPRLQDRPDDLRAVITDRLAREGLRVLGRPVGIEPAAYARLAEYPFPGDDAELSSIVQRLVAHCADDMVRLSDVTALRLSTRPPEGKRRKDPLSA
jgi:DNA-binding NtrC family response regulator